MAAARRSVRAPRRVPVRAPARAWGARGSCGAPGRRSRCARSRTGTDRRHGHRRTPRAPGGEALGEHLLHDVRDLVGLEAEPRNLPAGCGQPKPEPHDVRDLVDVGAIHLFQSVPIARLEASEQLRIPTEDGHPGAANVTPDRRGVAARHRRTRGAAFSSNPNRPTFVGWAIPSSPRSVSAGPAATYFAASATNSIGRITR